SSLHPIGSGSKIADACRGPDKIRHPSWNCFVVALPLKIEGSPPGTTIHRNANGTIAGAVTQIVLTINHFDGHFLWLTNGEVMHSKTAHGIGHGQLVSSGRQLL